MLEEYALLIFSVINSIIESKGGVFMHIHETNEAQIKTMRENFKLLRKNKNWSVQELSQLSGIDVKILTDIETGVDFGVAFLLALCRIYGITPSKIFLPIDA